MDQKLSHYQFSPETQYLDRKSARKKPSELLKHLIAFANADGGQVVIGIEDEKQDNIITGFKDGGAYPIEDFKKIDREMNEGVKRIYSEMESAFLHEPKYSEPGNKVVLTLENNIVSRHLRTRDSLEKQFTDFGDLNADEQLLVHYMYNSGEKMTTSRAVELTGRSRRHIGKILQKLAEQGILKWHGNSKNDKNQYYILASK